jgi:hypothetical protein
MTRNVIEQAENMKTSDRQMARVTEHDTSVKSPHVTIWGQQSIKNYFSKIEESDRQVQQESCFTDNPNNL